MKQIGYIVKYEILKSFKNFSFILAFLGFVLLMIFTTAIQIKNFNQKVEAHGIAWEAQKRSMDNFTLNYSGSFNAIKKSSNLSILFSGLENTDFAQKEDDTLEYPALAINPLNYLMPEFNLTFVIGVLGMLLVLFFSAGSFTIECEDETLPLLFSSSVSRFNLFLGKWVGGVIPFLFVFYISMVICIILVFIFGNVRLSFLDFISIGLIIIVVSIYYLISFLCGILFSLISKLTNVSLLRAILFWSIVIFIIPALIPSIIESKNNYPLYSKIEKQIRQNESDWRSNWREGLKDLRARNAKQEYIEYSLGKNGPFVKGAFDLHDKASKLKQEFYNKCDNINLKSYRATVLSPYCCLVYAINSLSGTGLVSVRTFNIRSLNYDAQLINWKGEIMQQEATRINLNEDIGLISQEINDIWNKNIDKDIPLFENKELSFAERFNSAGLNIIILIISMFLVGLLCYYKLNNYKL